MDNKHHAIRIKVLSLLNKHDMMFQTDLSVKAGIGESWTSELLKQMEEEGLVIRFKMEGDKRKNAVKITEAGKAALDMSIKEAQNPEELMDDEQRVEDILFCLTEKERKVLSSTYRKLHDHGYMVSDKIDDKLADYFSRIYERKNRRLPGEEKKLRKQIKELRDDARSAGYPIAIIYYSKENGFYERCSIPKFTEGMDPEADGVNRKFMKFLAAFLGYDEMEELKAAGHAIAEMPPDKIQ